jgi:transcriptional regulator with XRE-family HTH domain
MINSNVVTQRFTRCVKQLRENKTIKSSRQFALELDCLPQTLSEILNNRRDATIEVIRRAVERHHFNPIYLFTGEGDLFFLPTPSADLPTEETPESAPFDTPDEAHVKMMVEIKNLQNMVSSMQKTISLLVEKA